MKAAQTRALQNKSHSRPDWFRIEAKGETADVYLYDEIGAFGTSAGDFLAQLSDLSKSTLDVHINSMGGSVFDGIAIYNALRSHPRPVTTRIDSMAASIASVIAQAGDHRVMVEHSQMMIHEAALGFALGTATELRELADVLDTQSGIIADIYADSGKGSKRHFRELMSAETWFTDSEAVAEGLADEVWTPPAREIEETDVAAKVNWSEFLAADLTGVTT